MTTLITAAKETICFEARQNYSIFARQSNGEDGRIVPRYAA